MNTYTIQLLLQLTATKFKKYRCSHRIKCTNYDEIKMIETKPVTNSTSSSKVTSNEKLTIKTKSRSKIFLDIKLYLIFHVKMSPSYCIKITSLDTKKPLFSITQQNCAISRPCTLHLTGSSFFALLSLTREVRKQPLCGVTSSLTYAVAHSSLPL